MVRGVLAGTGRKWLDHCAVQDWSIENDYNDDVDDGDNDDDDDHFCCCC